MTDTKPKLRKEIGLLGVYTIATGATLSAGLFLLPGIAAAQAGPAMILAYIVAAIPLIPAMFSMIELATAMPRAGGLYYFLDRTLGPVVGTIGGIGTWLALVLKVSFALIGMGAYIRLFVPAAPVIPVAVSVALVLGILSVFGSKTGGGLQLALVLGLSVCLAFFIGGGIVDIDPTRFVGIFDVESSTVFSTAGLVYISYVGVTNVASLSEEVRDPERTLPLGVVLAMVTAIIVYVLATTVMVGVVPMDRLAGDLTPVATAADAIFGRPGLILLSIGALLAFVSVANAGTMSASRYPLAMSRDHLLPRVFRRIGTFGSPIWSILVTVATIVLILVALDATKIAKLASAFQLLMFALACLAVIVMRESRLDSYDPGYHSPLYPWMQIVGIGTAFWLIGEMGWFPLLFSVGLVGVGFAWYAVYARGRVARTGAIYHVFERLGRRRYAPLDAELRGILKEKGLRTGDPFDEIVARSRVLDLHQPIEFEQLARDVSSWFAELTPYSSEEIASQFLEGTRIGATPVTHGVALPHLRVEGLSEPEMVLVRCSPGAHIVFMNPLADAHRQDEQIVHAVFFLVSPDDNPTQHLRMLAQIASRVDDEGFSDEWDAAKGDQELREALLHADRFITFTIPRRGTGSELVNVALRDFDLPESCLVALLCRQNEMIAPHGDTVLSAGDRLTFIGSPHDIRELRTRFGQR
jgi:basic amino acid/polyamine antiporter, APA family